MKNKDILPTSALPVYEVTELTMEEALLELSSRSDDRTKPGILAGEALERHYLQYPGKDLKH